MGGQGNERAREWVGKGMGEPSVFIPLPYYSIALLFPCPTSSRRFTSKAFHFPLPSSLFPLPLISQRVDGRVHFGAEGVPVVEAEQRIVVALAELERSQSFCDQLLSSLGRRRALLFFAQASQR